MKNQEQQQNLIFYTAYIRRAHGCLPLFFFMAALFLGGLLCTVNIVRPAKPERPQVGTVYGNTDALTRFMVQQRSILPLLYPASLDLEPRGRVLPLTREMQPVSAPPLPLYPTAPDSAVLDTEQLLELPPEGKDER